MGFGIERDDEAFCFNGAMSWQMGWYASKSRVVEPSAGGCFEGNVHGISDFGNAASSTVILKINDLSSTDYYVAFNCQSGINSGNTGTKSPSPDMEPREPAIPTQNWWQNWVQAEDGVVLFLART